MTQRIDYQQELNPAQCEAVLSTKGPYLVIAGAGSGKTRVLVYRTAYLVEQGVDPQQILLLTFTRRAAQEMLARASGILDDRCAQVAGGTFHSFANRILRRYPERLGLLPNFTIMDQADAASAMGVIRTRLGLNKADQRFPRKQTLRAIHSARINKGLDLETILYDEYPHFLEYGGQIQQVLSEYDRYKHSLSLLDFDDLLVYLRDLLAGHEDLRGRLSDQYPYIMVDEYQDTNLLQAEIIQYLTQRHQNIMVVGDDSQSIYAFRGANFKNIINFPRVFPGTRVITLEQNYRSSQPILDLTNQVIRSAAEKFDKELFTQVPGTRRPCYVEVYNENGQSKYVVEEIARLQREGVPLDEIAVLFRSGWHSNDLEVELSAQDIPFVKFGGQKFVDAAHIKDIMSFLSVCHHPINEVSWLRILTMLRGIGPQTAQRIVAAVVRAGGLGVDPAVTAKRPQVRGLFELLSGLDPEAQSPREILDACLGFYFPLLADLYDDYDKRINDLESLQRIAARYDGLEQFLSDMALEPPASSVVESQAARAGGRETLVLSTIHSAKGLEWHTVFVLFVAEGFLPSYQSLDDADAVEEERRLFYVATTRAKQNLFLLRPRVDRSNRFGSDRPGLVYTRLSRFLAEEQMESYLEVSAEPAASPDWDGCF